MNGRDDVVYVSATVASIELRNFAAPYGEYESSTHIGPIHQKSEKIQKKLDELPYVST